MKTSRIMICPDDKRPEAGTCITIHRDVTFTTEKILEESNAETMDKWGAQISEFTPRAVIRYESGYFNAGTTQCRNTWPVIIDSPASAEVRTFLREKLVITA